jgi:hypothetical protein
MEDVLSFALTGMLDSQAVKQFVDILVDECFGAAGEDNALALYLSTLLENRRTLSHIHQELLALDFLQSDCDKFVTGIKRASQKGTFGTAEGIGTGLASNSLPPTSDQPSVVDANIIPVDSRVSSPSMPAIRPPILSKRRRSASGGDSDKSASLGGMTKIDPVQGRGSGHRTFSRSTATLPYSKLHYIAPTATPLPTLSVSPSHALVTKQHKAPLHNPHLTWFNKRSLPCKFGSACHSISCEYSHSIQTSEMPGGHCKQTPVKEDVTLRLARAGMRLSRKFSSASTGEAMAAASPLK